MTFMPNFVDFFVLLGIVLSCIHKISVSVTSAKRALTPAIVSLSTSQGGGQCPLVRDSELLIILLEIPRSPSLYMLISIGQARY